MRFSLGSPFDGACSLSLFSNKDYHETPIQNHSLLCPDTRNSEYLFKCLRSCLGNISWWIFPDEASASLGCLQELGRHTPLIVLLCHWWVWELVWGLPLYVQLNCTDLISLVIKKDRIIGIKLRSCTFAKTLHPPPSSRDLFPSLVPKEMSCFYYVF